jgi:ABC-type lipoprotein export system ATPase subunit
MGRVELIASAMCTWAVIDLAGTVTRSVRQAVSVTAITERLDEWIESPEDVPAFDTTQVNSPHEMICVTGPSGAGKTTFLASLAGITDVPPRSDVGGERALAIWSHGQEGGVTWVPTDSGPLSGYARDVLGVSGELEARASQLLIALGLSGDLNGSWAQLSRGEAARAALVRALLHRRDIVVLDDPTSALDDDSAQRVIDLLRREPGVIIVATHDERVIAHASSVWSITNR